MNVMNNLLIVGTSHVSKDSLERVRKAFDEFKPDIIAVELDKKRFLGLFDEKKASARDIIKNIGFRGYILLLIGSWIERKIGERTGVLPGSEMKLALSLAKKRGIPVALIDQDIEINVRRLSERFTFKEKMRLVSDFLFGFLKKKKFMIDISRVPDKQTINELINEVRENYPNVYQVLIEERNQVMAKNLSHIISINKSKKTLAVVGAGHEDELIRLVGEKI